MPLFIGKLRTRLSQAPQPITSPDKESAAKADAFRERELSLKEGEIALKRQELSLREREFARSRWTNPLVVAALVAVAAGITNAWLQYSAAARQAAHEQERWERTQKDENQKYLLIQVQELSANLSKMLSLVYYAITIYNRDLNPSLRSSPDIATDRSEIAYWTKKEFIDTTEAIERAQVVISARDQALGKRLDLVVNDVRLLSRQVSEDLILIGAVNPAKNFLRLNKAERQAAYSLWRTQWGLCRQALGPRIAAAIRPERVASLASGAAAEKDEVMCQGESLMSIVMRGRLQAAKPAASGNLGKR